jgi:hypothetical protein
VLFRAPLRLAAWGWNESLRRRIHPDPPTRPFAPGSDELKALQRLATATEMQNRILLGQNDILIAMHKQQ